MTDNSPRLIPDLLSEDNWNRFLKGLPVSESKDLADFSVFAEECDSRERICIERGIPYRRIAIHALAWERWCKEQDVLVQYGMVEAYCWEMYRQAQAKEERTDLIKRMKNGTRESE